MSQILVPVAVIGGMGLLFGALLGIASKIFAVKVDERIPQIVEVRPVKLRRRGFAGCNAYAAALAAGKAAPISVRPAAQPRQRRSLPFWA